MQTRSFFFVSEMVGYAMCNSDNGHSIIYKTINGGLSWFEFTEQGENLSHFAGINQPYLTGGNGLILKMEKLQKPTLAGYISGPDSACVNTKSSYITGPMTGVTYNWALTGGGTNVYLANRDTVLWNTVGTYTLSLSVSNACGTSEPRSLSIETSLFQPVISVQDSVLTAPEGLSYQWFRNSGFILEAQGGTAQSITVSTAGSYTVMVKSKYGCTVTTPAVYYSGAASKPICTGDTAILTSNVGGSTFRWQVDTGAGFQDIVNNNVYSGATTFSLRLANPPSAWYGYRYRCVTNFSISTVFKIQFENRWTGSADNTWENPANWSCGNLPDENTDVYINSGTVIINSDVTMRKLLLNPAANLTVQPGKTLTITH